MQYVRLGNSGIEVSRICFGSLVIGPLQANLSVDEGAEVILSALNMGINFIDTAEIYKTYPHIQEALKKYQKKVVVATKSYAYTSDGAKQSLEKAQMGLDRDYIDIFLLHEQESRLTLRGHREALEYFLEAKQNGLIGAVGVSTHNIEVVEACAQMPEIDIIHPIINIKGLGIRDGSIDEMLKAVEKAHDNGKGIYSMKSLGGGNLISTYKESLDFAMKIPFVDSIAIGMKTIEEVTMNNFVFEGKNVPLEIQSKIKNSKKKLYIENWCVKCGKCIKRCKQNALELKNGKVLIDHEKCILCGYCSGECEEFAIKVF